MNDRIKHLILEAEFSLKDLHTQGDNFQRLLDLIKQDIYNRLVEELIPDEKIDEESDIEDRCYLRGSNGGIIDALVIIKNFGLYYE
jgi:hypothetical protein